MDWEAEKRELPEYLLRLLKYRAEIEKMMKNKGGEKVRYDKIDLESLPMLEHIFFTLYITHCVSIGRVKE